MPSATGTHAQRSDLEGFRGLNPNLGARQLCVVLETMPLNHFIRSHYNRLLRYNISVARGYKGAHAEKKFGVEFTVESCKCNSLGRE